MHRVYIAHTCTGTVMNYIWGAVFKNIFKVFSDIKKKIITEIRFLDIRKNGQFSDIRKLITRSN